MSVLSALPPNTVSLLRSGQAITSVSCVVKELVENAIDAAATNIEVKLEDFGLDLIEVKDNGSGVAKADIRLMTAPHCTSKISSFEDLTSDRLQSFGFRGEALNALCSISDLEVLTKTLNDLAGTLATFDKSGNPVKELTVAANVGTTIRVSKLFSNVPVRRNYYSSCKNRKEEDFRKLKHLVTSYALIRPMLRIVLIHNKKDVFRKPIGAKNFEISANHVFGSDVCNCLQNIELEIDDRFSSDKTIVRLLVPKNDPQSIKTGTRSSSERLFCFVNDRPVIDKSLEKIVKKNFPSDKAPLSIVRIQVSAENVDVNLEPNKQTVFIRSKNEIDLSIDNALSTHYEKKEIDQNLKTTTVETDKNSVVETEEISVSKSVNVQTTTTSNSGPDVSHLQISSNFEESSSSARNEVSSNFDLEFDDSNLCQSSKENELRTIKSYENENSKTIETETRTRYSIEPTLTRQPRLNDITTNIRDNNIDGRTNAFEVLKSPNFVRIPDDTPTPRASEPKKARVEDTNQPKLEFFWKEGSELKSSAESQNSEAAKSWNRGNCLTDTQGEVVIPVTVGRPPMTSLPSPDPIELEEGDFVLVKRGSHELQLTPPNSGKKLKIDSEKRKSQNRSNESIDKFYRPKPKENIENPPPSDSSPQEDRRQSKETVESVTQDQEDRRKSKETVESVTEDQSPSKTEELHKERTKSKPGKPKMVRPSTEILFDFQRLSESHGKDQQTLSTPTTSRLLGQLSASGFWIVIDDKTGSLELVNHHRIVEVSFFNRLMKTQSLPSAPLLRGPLDLFEDPSWDPDLSKILLELAGGQTQNCVEISDPRFVLNGIAIQVRPGSGRAYLTGVSSVVNFMGSEDVSEVLRAIKINKNVAVSDCRPLKVKNYLMGEAVRLMRQSPPQLDRMSVERLVGLRTKQKIENCLHSKPVAQKLFLLTDIPN